MAFPKIDYCIICEDVRPEQHRKLSILGFYGLSPHVTILIQDINQPINQLTFMIGADRGEGTYKVAIELKDPDGTVLLKSPESDFVIPEPTRRNNWMFGVRATKFTKEGKHTFCLYVNGEKRHEADFEVKRGQPTDFTA